MWFFTQWAVQESFTVMFYFVYPNKMCYIFLKKLNGCCWECNVITLVMFTLLVSFRAVLGCQSKSVFFMSNDQKTYQGSCCTVLLRFARLKAVHTAKFYMKLLLHEYHVCITINFLCSQWCNLILDAAIPHLALTVLVMGVFVIILQN